MTTLSKDEILRLAREAGLSGLTDDRHEIKAANYTPPKPLHGLASYLQCVASGAFFGHPNYKTLLQWATEVEAIDAQLRSEVERVRREAVEECAVEFEGCHAETGEDIAKAIRELLK